MDAHSKYIVGLGELLFDVIDNKPVLGGAPVNFTIQAHQVLRRKGYQGAVAVRLGNDSLATDARRQLNQFGLTTEFIQDDPDRPTGTAIVHRKAVGHRFEIVEDVCWDYFQWNHQLESLAANAAVVCFGTLGQRSEQSRETIRKFVEMAEQALRVFDVNIRQHYYDDDVIRHGCTNADILKLNEEELPLVATAMKIPPASTDLLTCASLRAAGGLSHVVFTQGEKGTTVVSADGVTTGEPVNLSENTFSDSVGAGDACTAGIVAGTLLNLSMTETVQLANSLGAYVASRHGATPTLPVELLPW